MNLKPQDIVILLKLISRDVPGVHSWISNEKHGPDWTYQDLAYELFMSVSEVHAGVKRAANAGLLNLNRRVPIIKALEEFLIHGIKYAFPPEKGGKTRGLPTSYAGPPLIDLFHHSEELPPVWPYSEGSTWGLSFSPLYKTVPRAAEQDRQLYEMLVLVDAIRDGRARETAKAVNLLSSRLDSK